MCINNTAFPFPLRHVHSVIPHIARVSPFPLLMMFLIFVTFSVFLLLLRKRKHESKTQKRLIDPSLDCAIHQEYIVPEGIMSCGSVAGQLFMVEI